MIVHDDLQRLVQMADAWLKDPTGDPDRVEPLVRGVLSLVKEAQALRRLRGQLHDDFINEMS